MTDVGDLLARSRSANDLFHAIDRKRAAIRRALVSCIVQARAYRLAAHEADPEHADPEWANDLVPHSEMVAYFDRYLGNHTS